MTKEYNKAENMAEQIEGDLAHQERKKEKMTKEKTLNEKLKVWFYKWHRKVVTGRCLIELKQMNGEAISRAEKRLKEEIEKYHLQLDTNYITKIINKIWKEVFGENLTK